MMMMEFQTRSESNGLEFFKSFKEALAHAEKDKTVWKISFSLPNDERIRLVKMNEDVWVYEDIMAGFGGE